MNVEGGGRGPGRQRRPAVMSDVGRLAGVSHQTVSRVINGSPKVRPETRRARDRGDARARLPTELGRSRARHRADQHARRGRVRHDAVRPRLGAVRDRARGPRGGLLHDRRQPEGAEPLLGPDRDRAAAGPGSRRDPRDRARTSRRPRRSGTPRSTFRWWRSRPAPSTSSRWSPSTSTRARSAPPSTCSTSATNRSGTSRARRLARVARADRGLADDARGRRGRRAAAVAGRLERPRRL